MSTMPEDKPVAQSPPCAPPQMPQERFVVLYDGHCKLCSRAARKLVTLARPGAVEAVSFQEPGVLDQFPGLTHEACMQAMVLVVPDGRRFRGFEAAVRAVATRPLLRIVASAYYLPGIRQVCDRLYAWVAANRYRIFGKTAAAECTDGTCSLHFPQGTRNARKREADSNQLKQGEPL